MATDTNSITISGNITRDPRVIEAYLGSKFAARYGALAP